METVRTLVLHSQEIKNDKTKFIASSACINGNWYKIKFTQECDGAPKVKGIYDLTIDFDECSVEKGKIYTKADGSQGVGNPVIWVRHIVGLRKYTEDEMKQINRNSMSEIFGG